MLDRIFVEIQMLQMRNNSKVINLKIFYIVGILCLERKNMFDKCIIESLLFFTLRYVKINLHLYF